MTPTESYLKTLLNYKKAGGTIDDAIVIAKVFLLDLEKDMIEKYEKQIQYLKNENKELNQKLINLA
jgi:demethoxyubiquinone hydroxylase (CLK1/Coq7/Cat5 family)